jgi:uncharacterized membrane protein YgdD (TMEM256/DUF423 family)
MRKKATVFASISGCIAVILGALGAHGLSKLVADNDVASGMISKEILHAFETATHYQLLHAIALIAIVALPAAITKHFKAIAWLFMLGIVFFSGSIYLLVLGDYLKIDVMWAGPITPLGGLCLIAGWFVLFISALKYKEAANNEQKL